MNMTLLIMFASAEIGKKILREIDFGKLLGKSVLVKILVWLVIHCSYLIFAFLGFGGTLKKEQWLSQVFYSIFHLVTV